MKSKNEREKMLAEMLSIIRKKPGIRPREIYEIMGLEHSAPLRNVLIKRGLVRKERKGASVHYFPR